MLHSLRPKGFNSQSSTDPMSCCIYSSTVPIIFCPSPPPSHSSLYPLCTVYPFVIAAKSLTTTHSLTPHSSPIAPHTRAQTRAQTAALLPSPSQTPWGKDAGWGCWFHICLHWDRGYLLTPRPHPLQRKAEILQLLNMPYRPQIPQPEAVQRLWIWHFALELCMASDPSSDLVVFHWETFPFITTYPCWRLLN